MSEDNAPKLRLKPKLAADPAIAPQQLSPRGRTSPVRPTAGEESKAVRLKPRLSAPPMQCGRAGARTGARAGRTTATDARAGAAPARRRKNRR